LLFGLGIDRRHGRNKAYNHCCKVRTDHASSYASWRANSIPRMW
jgi:hypothetical protein